MSPALRTEEVQNDWSGGMFRDIAPALIPANGAYDLVDGLLDEDGNPYRRGGTAYNSQAPGAEEVLDSFNRPDENPVSDGGSWTGQFGGVGLAQDNLKVAGEELKAAGAEDEGTAIFNKSVTDEFVTSTVAALAGAVGTVALFIRTSGETKAETASGYKLLLKNKPGGSVWARLYRVDDSVATLLKSLTAHELVAGDQIGLKAVGSEISGWHKREGVWEQIIVATDTTYTTGHIGAGIYDPEGVIALDNFSAAALGNFSTTGLTWIWDGYLNPGQRTVFADAANFGVHDADEKQVNLNGAGLSLPKQSAVIEDLLFIGGDTIYGGSRKSAAYSTGSAAVTAGSKTVTGTGTAWATNVDAGMLLHIGSERVYVVEAVDSDTELTLRDAYEGTTGTGKTYSLSPLYTIGSDPYEIADFMTVCANRLVLLMGRRILFTEVDNPHSFTNFLGTTNEHTLPEGVEGVGLATVGQTVLVFTTGGVWVLDGLALSVVDQNGNPQHRLQQFSAEMVLADAPGLASSGSQLVVPTSDGIFLMNGISSPERISRPIDRLYRARISAGYRLGKAAVYRGHYLLPILSGSGVVRDLFVCRLDAPFRSRGAVNFPWSRLTGDGGEIRAYAVRSSLEAREPLLLGAQAREPSRVVDCSAYFEPDATHRTDADGTAHDFALVSRDIATGGDTENVIRSVELFYDLIDTASPVVPSTVRLEWSDGSYIGGEAEWDAVDWDNFDWAAEEEGATFNLTPQEGAPGNPGRQRFRINKRQRYGRLRVSTRGAPAFFALRQLKMNVRPSQAVRR